MPMISQLPPAGPPTAADLLALSQSGTTSAVSVGTLLASTQPAIVIPSGELLGRVSLGPGGPEAIGIGTGISISSGTLSALGITGAPLASSVTATTLVGISQNGTDQAVPYSTFLDGITIDLAQPAAPASDSDTTWVAQGSSTMLRQTFAAIWAWIETKIPTYKAPVVELTVNTTLDGTVHNDRLLVCSQPLTLSTVFTNMGSGFYCEVLNLSGGNVVLASGIVTSNGTTNLLPGQYASLRGLSYSGGNMVYAAIAAAATAAPGAVSGLTATNPTTNSIALSWAAPTSGAAVVNYTVQYRPSGTTTWNTASAAVTTTSYSVTGLSAGTSYDFQVAANNSLGSGPTSTVVTLSTLAAAGAVSSITWNLGPSGSYVHGTGTIGLNALVTPASAAVQFGVSASNTVPPTNWTAATLISGSLWGAYVPVPPTAGTYYAWCEGTDGSAATVYPSSFVVS
ncbi:MAG: fibronectin type III domain-containing protein [Acetobacteraceae bacterium]